MMLFLLLASLYGDPPDETHAWAVHDDNRPRPPVVSVSPTGVPSDAKVLFDGTAETLNANWVCAKDPAKGAHWMLQDGVMISGGGSMVTKEAFGDCQVHVEWCAPDDENPQHGNSGVYLMGLYEVQIINSHEIAPGKYHSIIRSGDEQAGCVYGQKPPLVNPIRKPGEWQTYDIVFHQPIHDTAGRIVHPGTITVFFNGVLVQDNRELEGPTLHMARAKDQVHEKRLPLQLQDHNGNVRFRNVWIRNLVSPWEEDLVSGTSACDPLAVKALRRATAERLLEEIKAAEDPTVKLEKAMEMLTYSAEEPFFTAARRAAKAVAEGRRK